jgi:hypothetical protein
LVYLLGRFSDTRIKKLAEKFLFKLFENARIDYMFSDKSNDAVMILRSMGISLLKLGCTKHENAFYELLNFEQNMSRINRHFHITYYMNGSYKLTDSDVVDNKLVYDFNNIKKTYDLLYRSIDAKDNPTHQYINIKVVFRLLTCFLESRKCEEDVELLQGRI